MPAHHAVHYHAAIASYPPQPRRHCQLPATPSPPLPAARRSLTMASLCTLAPAMPPAIKAMLHEKYEEIDPTQSITPLLDFIKEAEMFHEFAHARICSLRCRPVRTARALSAPAFKTTPAR